MMGATLRDLHGRTYTVTGQTPRKWLALEDGPYRYCEWSFPKKGGEAREARNDRGHTRRVFLTATALEAAQKTQAEDKWRTENRWKIARAVECFDGDVAVLRQIAALVGYVEPKKES